MEDGAGSSPLLVVVELPRPPLRLRLELLEVPEERPALEEAVEAAAGGVAVVAAHRQVLRALVAAAIGGLSKLYVLIAGA